MKESTKTKATVPAGIPSLLVHTAAVFLFASCSSGQKATPLIVHWPEGLKQNGTISTQVGHLIDIMPTCLELAGVEYPEEFKGAKTIPPEGLSLIPALNGRKPDREFLFREHEGNRAIRMGNWKLVAKVREPMKFTPGDENARELYNLESDPSETVDLAEKYPYRVKKMAAKWEE
ncbi:MAG: sulfatase/phosphatase domain-containing protein [Bacteroidales bacterium]